MNLSPTIEQEILDYLHLEYGESATMPDALKITELKYEGEYLLESVPTHFWWFPCGQTQCWATVAPFEESYIIGMTTTSPEKLEGA